MGFSNRSLDTSFYWSSQADHKLFELLILIWIPPHKMGLIALHCISRSKFLIIQSNFLAETEDISIGGENGEIPYDPIYLTGRTIRQPKMHLPLRDLEKVLLEHQ